MLLNLKILKQKNNEFKLCQNQLKSVKLKIELANKIAELFPELRKGYDLEGNAIVDLTKTTKSMLKLRKRLIKLAKVLVEKKQLKKLLRLISNLTMARKLQCNGRCFTSNQSLCQRGIRRSR